MYESPITQILGEIQTQYEDDCMKVVQQCGFDVNKEELTKALKYDRNQYSKGYDDGYNKAIDDFAEKMSDECFEQSMTVVFENRVKADVLTLDGLTELIFEIAEQLKAGDVDD